jgi:undecaprenyl diphosphate synthase
MVAESQVLVETPQLTIPSHVAIIMDGNGRWAQRRHLPRLAGHHAGVRNLHRIVRACADLGVRTLTVYAFSTENWGRPQDEVNGLMALFLDASHRETRALHRNGVRVRHVGSMAGVSPRLQTAIERAIELTRHNTRITLNVAFNYGWIPIRLTRIPSLATCLRQKCQIQIWSFELPGRCGSRTS